MAKRRTETKQRHQTGSTITTPSQFGSHGCMVVEPETVEGFNQTGVKLQDDEVLCKDDKGYYVTYKCRLDSGCADPRRYGLRSGLGDLV